LEKEVKNIAPVVLFAYNRPELVRRTLRSLKGNKLSSESDLYIFCDGPKSGAGNEQIKKVEEVRKVVREEKWCKTVTVVEQPINKGLADSVINGVSEIVHKYGKVIVVEDDVLLSPYFLDFMNECLETYKDNKKILAIGSWNYFCDSAKIKDDYFFFRYPDSIAWATTESSWRLFEKSAATALQKLIALGKLSAFNGDGEADYFESMLKMQMEGKINSWAIRWTATAVINDMLSVFPKISLSKHIGFGADATHETAEKDYNKDLVLANRLLKLDSSSVIRENDTALREWKIFVNTNFKVQSSEPGSESSLYNRVRIKGYRLVHGVLNKFLPEKVSEADELIKAALKFPRFKEHTFKYKNYVLKVSDFISVANQVKEYFDEEQLKFSCSKKEPVIIDCGSNVGVSVLYFKSLFPAARIMAFEPDGAIFNYLKENLNTNGVKDVNLVNKAVWTNENGIEFGSEGADGGSVFFEGGAKILVPTVSLKKILEQHDSVDMLKIDIEGAEIPVIIDCEEQIRKVKYLFVEYHSLLNSQQQLDKLLSILTANGFRYYINSIGTQAMQPFIKVNAYNGMDVQLNIFAVNQIG